MDTQRLILFFIFGFSLLMLWDAWEKENRPKPVPQVQQPGSTAAVATPAGKPAAQPAAATAPQSAPDGAVPSTTGCGQGQCPPDERVGPQHRLLQFWIERRINLQSSCCNDVFAELFFQKRANIKHEMSGADDFFVFCELRALEFR